MLIDLQSEPDLLESRVGLVLPGLACLLRRFVLELAVVHELDYRRLGLGCNLNKVEIGFAGEVERLADGDDSDLLPVGSDETDLRDSNPIIDTRLADVLAPSSPDDDHDR
nr:hypothetical protein GCM10023233_19680 [Brevibacterium otitidis]